MVSHEHKCIFVHIPKCGGTSVEIALSGARQDHRCIRIIEPLSFPFLPTADNLRAVAQRAMLRRRTATNPHNRVSVTAEQYESYFKFAFVRNPWSRAFSWYQSVLAHEIHLRNHKITRETSFREFLRRHAGKGVLKSQLFWLRNLRGAIPLDFLGRFERITQDWNVVCAALGVNIPLPHHMKGKGLDYREYYDDESIRLVERLYREEIELFEYSFDSPAPAHAAHESEDLAEAEMA